MHSRSCPFLGERKIQSCSCPVRLAAGTVDNLIGKLRAIFNEEGIVGDWNDALGFGNPASHLSIRSYLKSVQAEQAEARVFPKQAKPLFLEKLTALLKHLRDRLTLKDTPPLSLYIFARDLAFFSVDFFSGDRASDLGLILTKDVLNTPDSKGYFFRQAVGKSLGKGNRRYFAIRRYSQECPIH